MYKNLKSAILNVFYELICYIWFYLNENKNDLSSCQNFSY